MYNVDFCTTKYSVPFVNSKFICRIWIIRGSGFPESYLGDLYG